MKIRRAVDYDQYFGPPEQWMSKYKGRVEAFYLPFLQPTWNDPQHDHHVKLWRWLVRLDDMADDSDLIPEADNRG